MEVDESSSSQSSPRSSCGSATGASRIKCLCSYGGRILPRPQDAKLRYIGGETRILVLERGESLASVMAKLEKLCSPRSRQLLLLKYQLPNEELDALVSVVSDEDLEHMLDECAKLGPERLRTFVFFKPESPKTKPSAALAEQQLSPRSCLDVPKLQARAVEYHRRVAALASPAACCGSPRQHYYLQQQQQYYQQRLAPNEYLFGALNSTCSSCTAAAVQDHCSSDAAGMLDARYRLLQRQQRCCKQQVVAPRNPGFECVVPAVRYF